MDLERRVWSGWESARRGRWSLQDLRVRLLQEKDILHCRLDYASRGGWEKLWVTSLECYAKVLDQLLALLHDSGEALPPLPETCRIMLREVGWTLDWLAEQKAS